MTTDADNIPALPTALEQRVRIAKDADTLGLQAGLWIRTDLMLRPDTDLDPAFFLNCGSGSRSQCGSGYGFNSRSKVLW
jgi:hypothetical protein